MADDAWITAALVVGGGLLALKLLTDAPTETETPSSGAPVSVSEAPLSVSETGTGAPVTTATAVPQDRPGAWDAGGAFTVYTLPPGMTPKDVADWYAAQGRAHDAAAVLNDVQNAGPSPPPVGDVDPVATTTTSAGVPQDGAAPTTPAKPAATTARAQARETHEDILGRTRSGPPSRVESIAKPIATYGGGTVLETVGTAAGLAKQTASGARTVGALRAAGGVAGPIAAGVGAGLQVTQVLQETGFFDQVVKPSGAAASAKLGPTGSKATATALLPLSVPGAVVKAAVTPGESVVGNIHRAAQASFIPEAVQATQQAAAKTARAAGHVRGVATGAVRSVQRTGSAFTSFLSKRWF